MTVRKIFLLGTLLLIFSSTVDAAKVDIYREALLNKSFTLKYEIVDVPIVETSHDAIYSSKGLVKKEHTSFWDYLHKGIIVFDGDNSYNETSHDDYTATARYFSSTASRKIKAGGYCGLVKDGKVYRFRWDEKDGKRRYFGSRDFFGGRNTSVEAKDKDAFDKFLNSYQRFVRDYSSNFGTSELDRALLPLIPPEKIIATDRTPEYKFFASGTLDGGLTYEDFVSDKGNTFSAVRYYFDGDNMVKIALVNYVRDGENILSYDKSVINITEFSTTPDQSYLKLPAELKDKTKR